MNDAERELDLQLGEALARIRELEEQLARARERVEYYERAYPGDVRLGLSNGPVPATFSIVHESTGETD